MSAPKRLTPMQIKFAELIVYGVEGNPITKTEAAKLAGYSTTADRCQVAGSDLTNPVKYPLVCAHISNMRDEVRHKYGISYEGHLEELGKIRDQSKKGNRNLAAAATTEIARGKVGGYYIDQKIIRHGNIDDMNLEQLYERMRTIKEKNQKVLEAKKLLETSGKLRPKDKGKTTKKLSLPPQIPDPDSTP